MGIWESKSLGCGGICCNGRKLVRGGWGLLEAKYLFGVSCDGFLLACTRAPRSRVTKNMRPMLSSQGPIEPSSLRLVKGLGCLYLPSAWEAFRSMAPTFDTNMSLSRVPFFDG